jgi:hypothetical protein
MDGKGSWRDNVSVERLWRSIKYEEVRGLARKFGKNGGLDGAKGINSSHPRDD